MKLFNYEFILGFFATLGAIFMLLIGCIFANGQLSDTRQTLCKIDSDVSVVVERNNPLGANYVSLVFDITNDETYNAFLNKYMANEYCAFDFIEDSLSVEVPAHAEKTGDYQ